MNDFLECPICSDYFTDVIETNCCHRCFCKECLRNWIVTKSNCPSCRSALVDVSSCRPNIPFQRLVDELPATCENAPAGCTDKITRGIVKDHTKACMYSLIVCDFGKQNCAKLLKKDLAQHKLSCPFRIEKCDKCGISIEWLKLENHKITSCDYTAIKCPNNCEEMFVRKDSQNHFLVCGLQVVTCQLSKLGCKFKGFRKDLNQHLKENSEDHLKLSLQYISTLEDQFTKLTDLYNEQTAEIDNLTYGMKQLSVLKPRAPHCPLSNFPVLLPSYMRDQVHNNIITINGQFVSMKQRTNFNFNFGFSTSMSSVVPADNSAIIPADVLIPNLTRFTELPYYFEMTIVKSVPGCNIGIGLVEKFHDMKGLLGASGIAYGYYPLKGKLLGYNENKIPKDSIEIVSDGRPVIGCGYDPKNGIIFFTVNGQCTGATFKNVNGFFYPAVCLDTPQTEISMNFGQSPFRFQSKFWLDMRDLCIGLQLCLENNICTFSATGQGFAPQITFKCVTCNLIGNYGTCATCARVCHKGHELTRGFSMAFFCDCGYLSKEKKLTCCCLKDDEFSMVLEREKLAKEKKPPKE